MQVSEKDSASLKESSLIKLEDEGLDAKNNDEICEFKDENYDPLTKDLVPVVDQNANQLFNQSNGSEIPKINNIQLVEGEETYPPKNMEISKDSKDQNECFSPI